MKYLPFILLFASRASALQFDPPPVNGTVLSAAIQAGGVNGSYLTNITTSPAALAYGVNFASFTGNGTFTAPAGVSSVCVWALGGGGGGATGQGASNNGSAGGGGSGGLYTKCGIPYTGAWTITIGAGGATDTAGSETDFGAVAGSSVAYGGGPGSTSVTVSTAGASTGGGFGGQVKYSVMLTNQGNFGGRLCNGPCGGGGIGGPGEVGYSNGATVGYGGRGIPDPITGVCRGGGGAGSEQATNGAPGYATCGGGNTSAASGQVGGAGTANTGGGGGGGGTSVAGGAGGSGIVFIWW